MGFEVPAFWKPGAQKQSDGLIRVRVFGAYLKSVRHDNNKGDFRKVFAIYAIRFIPSTTVITIIRVVEIFGFRMAEVILWLHCRRRTRSGVGESFLFRFH